MRPDNGTFEQRLEGKLSGEGVFQVEGTPRAKTLKQKYVASVVRAEWPRQGVAVAEGGLREVAWETDDHQVRPTGILLTLVFTLRQKAFGDFVQRSDMI